MRVAAAAAPKPLSMFTTVTPAAQEFSIVKRITYQAIPGEQDSCFSLSLNNRWHIRHAADRMLHKT